jgi:membrane-associated phospholipid phosphatase
VLCGAAAPSEPSVHCGDEGVAAPQSTSTAKQRIKQVACDAKDIFPAPVKRWHATQWKRFGEGVALLFAYPLDQKVSNILIRNHTVFGTRYLHAVTHLGGGYGEELTFVMIAGGYVGHDQHMIDTGFDALEASVFAGGIVTPAIKDVVGRARPIADLGKHSFHPFNNGVFQSFPSGHATSAFAIATAISDQYSDHPVVPVIAYTLATSVAFARVYDQAHYPSDVIAGALIGRAMAKSIVHNHVTIIPEHRALLVHVTF